MPVLPSPSTTTRKKRVHRRPTETSVCKVCQRGHSPISNVIVFCDGCNSGYHQYCHNPPIDREVVQVAEKEWFCGACTAAKRKQGGAIPIASGLVSGVDLSREEVGPFTTPSSKPSLTSELETSLLLHALSSKADRAITSRNRRTPQSSDLRTECPQSPQRHRICSKTSRRQLH